ncbi:MAG: tetratricopeptide repeat protein [Bacteroidales bacterium]|nr:tetratricopeptide repeat protein [Bacteroidales bacterium]
MRKTIILFLTILFTTTFNSYPYSKQKIDSLKIILKSSNADTTKVNILNELFYELRYDSTNQAIIYVKEALEISKKVNYKKGIANSIHNIGIGNYYQSNYNEAIKYLLESLKLAKEIKDSILISKSIENIALSYEVLGEYEKALEYYTENLKINEQIKDKYSEAITKLNIANIYFNKGEYSKALGNYIQSMSSLEELGYKSEMSKAMTNVGNVYYRLKYYEKALEYYLKSFEIKQELGDKKGSANLLNNIGSIYYTEENFDKSIEYFKKSLRIREEIGNKFGIASSLSNIGVIYRIKGNLEKALEYQKRALIIKQEIGSKKSIAYTFDNIGRIYLEKRNYRESFIYFNKGLKIYSELGNKQSIAESNYYISGVFAEMKNYKKAYNYYILYHQLMDSIFNENMSKQIAEMQTKYETEKKEKEIELQKVEIINKENQIKQKKLQQNITIIVLFFVLIILIIIYIIYRQKRKANILLTKQKEEILDKNEELYQQKEEIKVQSEIINKANKEIIRNTKLKELFFASTSHEIRTPINVIVGFTNLLLNSKLSTKQKSYIENIRNSGKNLLVIINDILDFSKIEAKRLKIKMLEFNLFKLIDSFYNSIKIRSDEKKLDLILETDNKLPEFVIGDPVRLTQILTNLVANAIKFTSENGKIKIKVELINDNQNQVKIRFKISDTGIGIHENKIQNIFENYTQANIETTRTYGGTGLGLSIVKNLIELQNGEISVESELGKGSTFSFTLNYTKSDGKKLPEKPDKFKIDKVKEINKMSILLVDDNVINRTLAIDTIHLFNDKIMIDEAVNGKIAVDLINRNEYALVLMDIVMPVMNGYEATNIIRNKLPAPKNKIPILGMTANILEEERKKCLSIGMNEYITKPFEPKDLFSKIMELTK